MVQAFFLPHQSRSILLLIPGLLWYYASVIVGFPLVTTGTVWADFQPNTVVVSVAWRRTPTVVPGRACRRVPVVRLWRCLNGGQRVSLRSLVSGPHAT